MLQFLVDREVAWPDSRTEVCLGRVGPGAGIHHCVYTGLDDARQQSSPTDVEHTDNFRVHEDQWYAVGNANEQCHIPLCSHHPIGIHRTSGYCLARVGPLDSNSDHTGAVNLAGRHHPVLGKTDAGKQQQAVLTHDGWIVTHSAAQVGLSEAARAQSSAPVAEGEQMIGHVTMMRHMQVPFLSQRDFGQLADDPRASRQGIEWHERSCAVACLTMVLQHFGRSVTMDDVLLSGLAHNAFDPTRGWLHSGQVAVLQSYGLAAYRRNWRLMDGRESEYLAGRRLTPLTRQEVSMVQQELLEEGVWTVRRLTRQIPLILSIFRPWGDDSSIGHQVVILNANESCVTFHDPAERAGANICRPAADFFGNWKGTAIVAFHQEASVNPNRG